MNYGDFISPRDGRTCVSKMKVRESVFFVLFITSVVCDECVRYTFEEGNFEDLFDNMAAPCFGMPKWEEQDYSSISLDRPHDSSETFISPLASFSCVSSYPFTMSVGGIIEVNVYMNGGSSSFLNVLASQINLDGDDGTAGSAMYNPSSPDYFPGWHTLRFTVSTTSSGNFDGYVSY